MKKNRILKIKSMSTFIIICISYFSIVQATYSLEQYKDEFAVLDDSPLDEELNNILQYPYLDFDNQHIL